MFEVTEVRRVLINSLVESAFRFATTATLDLSPFLTSLCGRLRDERAALATLIVHTYKADVSVEQLVENPGTGVDAAQRAVEAAAQFGGVAVALVAIQGEDQILSILDDLEPGAITEDIRNTIQDAVQIGMSRLHSAVEAMRNQSRVMTFGTKSTSVQSASPIYEVWFGTNRNPILKAGKVTGFGGSTHSTVTLGRCEVAIPKSHRIGQAQPNLFRRLLGDRPMTLEAIETLGDGAFWSGLGNVLRSAGVETHDAIVFLHGYNVSFESAAVSAAQIGADLGIPGAMAFFSWPSQGRTLGYTVDEASIDASEVAITDFLENFANYSGARRIHIVAHSMGNRGLLRAVDRMGRSAAQRTGKLFGQIILAAPDVDARLFRELHAAYGAVCERATLYVSDRDLAVRSSRLVHGADRVGLAPPVTVVPGVDTVSVSNVDLSFLGHGYLADCRLVMIDMHQLLVSDIGPAQRAGMRPLAHAQGAYWELAE